MITGGLGKIGLLLASYLARTYQACIILLVRTAFPERTAWPQWLEKHDELDMIGIIIRELLVLEQSGAEFLIVRANVARDDEMRQAMDTIQKRFGLLHGIFHTAGITKGKSIGSLIKEVKFEESEEQFQPKVYGLYLLERFLEQWSLDFCILFSSDASVLGSLGLLSDGRVRRTTSIQPVGSKFANRRGKVTANNTGDFRSCRLLLGSGRSSSALSCK